MDLSFNRERNIFVVGLSDDECDALVRGEVLSQESMQLSKLSATVEVKTYRRSYMAKKALSKVYGTPDGLVIDIPRWVIADNLWAAEHVDKDSVQGDASHVPNGGIRIEFGESEIAQLIAQGEAAS